MCEVAIIADDLTGANAAGALLAGKGLKVLTSLGLEGFMSIRSTEFDAICVSTDSRLIPASAAREAVHAAVSAFMPLRPKVVTKRIDSTLRGNVGAEIEAALEAMGDEALAVVVPVFPASGRIAVGGYLIVNGVPLEKTAIANDPATPVHSSRPASIIAEQTALPINRLDLSTVMAGPDAIAHAVITRRSEGARILVADAVTDADIATIAAGLAQLDFPILSADPGPFTSALAEARGVGTRRTLEDAVLLTIGSASDLTCRQIEALRLAEPCALTRIDCRRLILEETRAEEISRAVRFLLDHADTAQVLGVYTVERREDVYVLNELAKQSRLTLHEVSSRINSGLAEISATLLGDSNSRIGGLYTSGGEVTLSVARHLGAVGFSVRDEVLPLAVYGRLVQGSCHDLPIVTKGGFVGDTQSLVQCVRYLKTKISTRTKLTTT
ncbi:uncharacterized protein YgbK (DUF1537 family) [Desulfomicrobium macestii]|uniref:Uncharacterized protein YgbK (DUF1537 family) n=1 Tax=Desulfomicrobium macestii TaxID=90731 RepID=A0ABR9H0L0_9BACT|nr:four-carbon acid sugar kinase family protein [Desulfomicrobium macestii]MBE1424239.1 uncharacterized protein YgbK (DUF1537 family) [Desulfomicrobium macestii]